MTSAKSPALPLFAYGSLRPGELAYRQIANFVAETHPATVPGYTLSVRDGLPLMVEDKEAVVAGMLLTPRPGYEEAFWSKVRAYEPKDLYRQDVVRTDAGAEATAYVGRRTGRSHQEKWGEVWSVTTDPMFTSGLAAISQQARHHLLAHQPMSEDMQGFWNAFIPLQGLYLVLAATLERYTALVFGPNLDPMERLKRLSSDQAAKHALESCDPPEVTVFDARDLHRLTVPGPRAYEAWYQVRSNITHRGKAAIYDFSLLERSLVGLHDCLLQVLDREVHSLAAAWQALPSPPVRLRTLYAKTREH